MAGDWIKMRMDLPDDPAVYKLSALTKLERFAVIGRLYAFWSWADKHAVDGRVDGATSTVVDDVVRFDGFADAMVAVKWLEIGEDYVAIPKHDRHNGESAKERSLKNARQARWREKKDGASDVDVDAKPSIAASTREEKRREDKNKEEVPSSLSADDIAFEFPLNDGTVYQLSRMQVAEFMELYPAVNVDGELRACLGWNRSNPRKRKTRSGILKHINGWLSDKQNSPHQSARTASAKFDPVAHVNRNRIAA